jgi:hypothetical protein
LSLTFVNSFLSLISKRVTSKAIKMKEIAMYPGLQSLMAGNLATPVPVLLDTADNITYTGLYRNGIEVFLNIPYGHGTDV